MRMEMNRRGEDRRRGAGSGDKMRPAGVERRELLKDPDQTAGRLRTIPLLEDLSTGQLLKLLGICSKRVYSRGEILQKTGDDPDRMFVLVQGRLQVAFSDGVMLENFNPVGIVGELGLITGEPRTATITAATECIVLLFWREELFRVFHEDAELWTKVLTNIIKDLVIKLHKESEALESLQRIRSFEIL
jgi:CRP-like cAMP-binding protein